MPEEVNQANPAKDTKKTGKKRSYFLFKIIIIAIIAIVGYFSYKSWKEERARKELIAKHSEAFSNIDSEVFDLSDEYQNESDDEIVKDVEAIAVTDLEESSPEFIYQTLIKNQIQIEKLKDKVSELSSEISKYKNRDHIGKIILSYVSLRDKIFANEDYSNQLKSFKVIAALDQKLNVAIARMQATLPDFSTKAQLTRQFNDFIPDLIAVKEGEEDGILATIRQNISKLAIVRRINDESADDIDGKILQVQKFLSEGNYQDALNICLSMSKNHHKILQNFLKNLDATIEVQRIDQEILNYLQSLS